MTLSQADFELLLQANRILSSKLDVTEVLQAVLELATKVVRAEASSLLLLDEKKNELYVDVALGIVKDEIKQIRLKVGEGIAGWVAKERAPLIVNDVTKDYRFTGKVDKSTSFKTRAILAVPLLSKGKLLGVVEAINKELNQPFTATDQEAFEIFASQSATALENARLFSDISREKEKLNTVFAQMSDGVMLLDENGRLAIMNEAGGRWIGLKPQEAVGKLFGPDLFPGFENPPTVNELKTVADKTVDFDLIRKKGKDLVVIAQVNKLESAEKKAEGYLVLLRDVTEEKREGLLKQNFLSLISHKLKTPLTVIVGYGPALLSATDNLSPFQVKAIRAISDQGDHLIALVDKLLRFTLVESDHLKRTPEAKDIAQVVKEAVNTLGRETKVEVKLAPDLAQAPKVWIDNQLMVEVFKNLFENAVKFNDKEKKEISVSAKKDKKHLRIDVTDNGVGIPPEERAKIFAKFYQIENSFTGQVPGAGLGLAFCRRVLQEMGGSIEVDSTLGKGSTFTVSVPLK